MLTFVLTFFGLVLIFLGLVLTFLGHVLTFFVDVVGPVTVARAGKAHMHAEAPPRRQNKPTKSAPARKKSAADKKKVNKGGYDKDHLRRTQCRTSPGASRSCRRWT